MYRIAVLGEYDSIYGFATLGLETFPVSDAEQGSTQLEDWQKVDMPLSM